MNIEAPPAMPFGVSARQAITLCRNWMIHLGAIDTVESTDDVRQICDLYSRRYIAWVDNRRGNLDVRLVLNAAQTAASDGRQGLVFSRGGAGPEAQRQADSFGLALFSFDAIDGLLEGANRLGYQLRAAGFNT